MKTAFIVVIAIAAATAETLVCEPGSLFKVDCNSCKCAQDGKSMACTGMICPPSEVNQLEADQRVEKYCQPGALFKVDCNTCTCSEDGTLAACTDMVCPPKEVLISKPKQVCEPRSQFKEYCNTCFCSEDGTSYGCTRMECDENIWNKDGSRKLKIKNLPTEPKQVCTPGSTYKDYCNTCTCSDDGLSSICTRMYCDRSVWNKNGTSKLQIKNLPTEPKQVCTPRSTYKDYCNTCTCSDDGLSSICTRMYCDRSVWNKNGTSKLQIKNLPSEPKQVCTPRSTYKEYCNTCTCSDDGLSSICTRMYCDRSIWNKNGTSKLQIKNLPIEPKQVCTPFTAFKDYCNTCFCAADGMSAACTKMFCDEAIWNKDGTAKVEKKNLPNEDSAPKQVCEPSSTFKDYCNICACTKDGLSYGCTKMYCDKNLWHKNGTRKVEIKNLPSEVSTPKQVCQPRAEFKLYCNTCFCSNNGLTFGCTRMYCDKSIWNKNGSLKKQNKQVCEPGSTYKADECNTCVCNEDGTDEACTFELCSDQKVVKREANWGSLYEQGDACTPGKLFYSECNKCICTKSGNSAFCTMMNC